MEIQTLVAEFSSLFQPPTQLPPSRAYDHAIPLIAGAAPVYPRPYCFAPAVKDEIEKQVQEMLSTGLIQKSSSPFSSSILLLKTKDNSWRFCMDYRALNDHTVKDKFPIPVVEELIDELHGARFFTKLDLCAGYHQVRVHPDDIEKHSERITGTLSSS